MFYKRFTQQSDHPKWGGATYFFETDKSNKPIRQLVVYESGKTFAYDTDNRSDEAGNLYDKPLFTTKAERKEWNRAKVRKGVFNKAWSNPELVPTDFYEDVVNSVRSASIWSFVLAFCYIVGAPLLEYFLYKHPSSNSTHNLSHQEFVAGATVNIIIGLFLGGLSILLRRTNKQNLLRAGKLLQAIMLVVFGVALLNTLAGESGGIGILGLVVILKALSANRKLLQGGILLTTSYRLKVGVAVIVILFAAGAAIIAAPSQQNSQSAESAQNTTKPKQGKKFTSTAAAAQLGKATTIDQAEQALQAFVTHYNLKVQISSVVPSSYVQKYDTYTPLTADDLPALKAYGSQFIDEWSKYPLDWVQHSKLQSVTLVKQLAVSEVPQRSTADPVGQSLYYDVTYNDAYTRSDVHENFFKLITYNDFGSYNPNDTTWASYNPAGFTYNNTPCTYDEKSDAPSCTTTTEHPLSGFVSYRATTSMDADKTEIYGDLMTTSSFHDLNSWLTNDSHLQKKVRYLVSYMNHYAPEMHGDYFSQINP